LLLVLVVTFVIVMYNRAVHSNEVQRERQREAIAAFVAPPGWEEHLEGVYPGEFGGPCLILSLCELHQARRWEASEPQSRTSLIALAEASGWKEIEFSAEPADLEACGRDGLGSLPWCPLRVNAVSGKVLFKLRAWQEHNSEVWTVDLGAH